MKYRKKPVVNEAWRLDFDDEEQWQELAKWCGGRILDPKTNGTVLALDTLEGTIEARPGDYIIRDIGGFYPCKSYIFEETYGLVE